MQFDTLYKKSKGKGKFEQWSIQVVEKMGGGNIITHFGEVGGKIQEGQDFVSTGKNQGKKNETTAFQQACAEAKSKWEKKLKSGYVKSLELAESGAKDDIIEGGIEPMLAHPFEKQGEKISYPCLAQPKLDGMRCVAIKKGDDVTLWTRTRKPIRSCPHIEASIRHLPIDDIVLDGELYNHEYKNDFEKIVSAVRKDEPSEESKKVQYHVYDYIPTAPNVDFVERARLLANLLPPGGEVVVPVKNVLVKSAEDVPSIYERFAKLGYEGAMLRNGKGAYENRRSTNLIKVKKFEDAEFTIVGGEEGRGKLAGHLGAFTVKTESGDTFNVKMTGDQAKLVEYWENLQEYVNKKLTVQYQGMTKYNIPRFPVGKSIRDYE